jgi:catechol 2,3-dioxygenase-like lactoylglutathione lyase family enzyme
VTSGQNHARTARQHPDSARWRGQSAAVLRRCPRLAREDDSRNAGRLDADLEALRERIQQAGIALDHDPTPIHNRPRAFLRDPFGNLIELSQIDGRYEEV